VRARSMAWVRGISAIVALLFALTLGTPPALAAGANDTAAKPARTGLAAAAAARVAAAPPVRLAQDSGTTSSGGSRSFFRSPTGMAAIALMVVGGGYAIYSAHHDQKPVKSPIR